MQPTFEFIQQAHALTVTALTSFLLYGKAAGKKIQSVSELSVVYIQALLFAMEAPAFEFLSIQCRAKIARPVAEQHFRKTCILKL
jgi:hypothetical protein